MRDVKGFYRRGVWAAAGQGRNLRQSGGHACSARFRSSIPGHKLTALMQTKAADNANGYCKLDPLTVQGIETCVMLSGSSAFTDRGSRKKY